MGRRVRVFVAAVVVAASCLMPGSAGAGLASAAGPGWAASWSSALAYAPSGGSWSNQTLRMVAHTSAGGAQLRARLSNRYATTATTVGHVTVGVQSGGGNAAAAPVTVLFGGAQAVTLPAGGTAVSDPVALPVAAATRLLVSVFFPAGANAVPPRHDVAGETEYNYVGGDASGAAVFPVTNTFAFAALVDGVDVASAAGTVVVVGDSVSDGLNLPADTDTRWPDRLAARVADSGLAVVDEGVSGDEVTRDQPNTPGIQSRWAVDVLGQPGVRTVIEQGGINDIRTGVPVTVLESAQASLVASAHAVGVRVLLTTLTPMAGSSGDSPAQESALASYNAWVLGGGSGADGVVDFNAVLNNGAGALAAAYDSGDHLHPNAAGALVLAGAVPTTGL